MKYLVIYHKEDNDGLFSMAIICNYLVNELKVPVNKIEIFGANYNDLAKFTLSNCDDYTHVFMSDISFNDLNMMKKMYDKYGDNFTWIDHHAPVIENAPKFGFDKAKGLRDTHHSALQNAFTYLYPKTELPKVLHVLSAFDSMTAEQEGYTKEYCNFVNTGVNNKYDLQPKDIITYVHELIYGYTAADNKADLAKFEADGKFENNINDRNNKNIIKDYGDLTWTVENRKACALFLQGRSSSFMFETVKNEVLNGIVFKHQPDGNWTLSLYNTDDDNNGGFHCGNYLKEHYNGGGHEGAAGATITQEQFIEILKKKSI